MISCRACVALFLGASLVPCWAQRIDDRLPAHPLPVQKVLPHVLLGQLGPYTFQAEFAFANETDETAHLQVDLYTSDGQVPAIRFKGAQNPSTGLLTSTLAPRTSGVLPYRELADSQFFSGWGIVRSNHEVAVSLRIVVTSPDGSSSELQSQGDPRHIRAVQLPTTSFAGLSLQTPPLDQVGVAIVNPNLDAPLQLRIQLLSRAFNRESTMVDERILTLEAGSKLAVFQSDIFGQQQGNLVRIEVDDSEDPGFGAVALQAAFDEAVPQRILLGPVPSTDVNGDGLVLLEKGPQWEFPLLATSKTEFLDFEILNSEFGVLIDRDQEIPFFLPHSMSRSRARDEAVTNDHPAVAVIRNGLDNSRTGPPGATKFWPIATIAILLGDSGKVLREPVPDPELEINVLEGGRVEIHAWDPFAAASSLDERHKWILLDTTSEEIVDRFVRVGSGDELPPWRD